MGAHAGCHRDPAVYGVLLPAQLRTGRKQVCVCACVCVCVCGGV